MTEFEIAEPHLPRNNRPWRVKLPTRDRLLELLDYHPETGLLYWRVSSGSRAKAGALAGGFENGYIRVSVDGFQYKAHRLVWVICHGEMPEHLDIDHINGDRSDNRASNLRLASRGQNMQNRSKPQSINRTGYLGVGYCTREGKYSAQIWLNRKKKHIGYFASAHEAHLAYLKVKKELHQFAVSASGAADE